MPRQGLNAERIVEEAVRLVEEKGEPTFSMAELAGRLRIQPSSLYNHIPSQQALLVEVGLRAIARMAEAEERAVEGRQGDEAVYALAEAYRRFAKEHNGLYSVVMNLQRLHSPALERETRRVAEPILKVLDSYGLKESERAHLQRALRSLAHGFVCHEEAGWFSHFPVDREASFRFAIRCIVNELHRMGRGESEDEVG